MVKRVLSALPGMKRPGAGRFFYPRQGYGQISDALHKAAVAAGAQVELGATVTSIVVESGKVHGVEVGHGRDSRLLPASYVLSTIPVTMLPRLVKADGAELPSQIGRRALLDGPGDLAHLRRALIGHQYGAYQVIGEA